MSLFKARDFWSFELEQLEHRESITNDDFESENIADFVVAVGRFSALSENADVIVAGNLRGYLYCIQIPSQTNSDGQRSDARRQLLAASNLVEPIVDVKCGYFTSASKQSISILSFDKLRVYQIKMRQVDLLSALIEEQPSNQNGPMLIDESLLSHEFEELYSLNLISNGIAQSILLLDTHSDKYQTRSSIAESNDKNSQQHGEASVAGRNKFIQRSKQIVNQMRLPQRDKIIVQYTDQFLLTLIDHKKVVAHFELTLSINEVDNPDKQRGAQDKSSNDSRPNPGVMPMAFLNSSKFPSVIVSMSNYKLYCIPLSRLNQRAEHDVVKRVALGLLQTNSNDKTEKSGGNSSRDGGFVDKIIIDLSDSTAWTCELLSRPVQMLGMQRQARDSTSPNHRDNVSICQFLVMSRYQIDLYSESAQHLWSQKFETPLICFSIFKLDIFANGQQDSTQHQADEYSKLKSEFLDEIVTLVCTSCLSDNKSNMIILKEDQICWSALLNTRPLQIWRMDSDSVPGLIATLDARTGQLTAGYLGTNLESFHEIDDKSDEQTQSSIDCFAKLEQLDGDPSYEFDTQGQEPDELNSNEANLIINCNFEARNEWPNVQVACTIDISPTSNSSSVMHDIITTIEFDDLLKIELSQELADLASYPSTKGGVVQLRLGNIWPDRRESIKIQANFSIASSSKTVAGVAAMDKLDSSPALSTNNLPSLVPNSLEVKLYLSYQDSHSGTTAQEESFLLPLSMLVNLAHVDYTSGHGQSLTDVLGNLGNLYKQPTESSHSCKRRNDYYLCDMFLNLNCDFIELIDEFIEKDIVCRVTNRSSGSDKAITLENINMLAQSLDCRLCYRNPVGFERQSSEDQAMPVMVNFALRFENPYENIVNRLNMNDMKSNSTSNDLVWVHMCELSPGQESPLGEEFVMFHKSDWYNARTAQPENLLSQNAYHTSKTQVLVSVECEHPIPVIFFYNHLASRLRYLTSFGQPINVHEMNIAGSSYKDLLRIVKNGYNLLAASSNLYNSIGYISKSYNSTLKHNQKNRRDDLTRNLPKFQLSISTSLSQAKRLPDLTDEMVEQSQILRSLTKFYLANMMHTLDELGNMRLFDYELSKLPSIDDFKIQKEDIDWPWLGFGHPID